MGRSAGGVASLGEIHAAGCDVANCMAHHPVEGLGVDSRMVLKRENIGFSRGYNRGFKDCLEVVCIALAALGDQEAVNAVGRAVEYKLSLQRDELAETQSEVDEEWRQVERVEDAAEKVREIEQVIECEKAAKAETETEATDDGLEE